MANSGVAWIVVIWTVSSVLGALAASVMFKRYWIRRQATIAQGLNGARLLVAHRHLRDEGIKVFIFIQGALLGVWAFTGDRSAWGAWVISWLLVEMFTLLAISTFMNLLDDNAMVHSLYRKKIKRIPQPRVKIGR